MHPAAAPAAPPLASSIPKVVVAPGPKVGWGAAAARPVVATDVPVVEAPGPKVGWGPAAARPAVAPQAKPAQPPAAAAAEPVMAKVLPATAPVTVVAEQGASGGVSGRKVVIDAGAAIKLQRLDRFGGELFTTGGVIREIKDENARNLLRSLPQELRVREPLAQDIIFVKQFAKATGDIGFLSQNDMELIALTVQLHREEGGSVRQRPEQLGTQEGTAGFDWAPANTAKAAAVDGEASATKEVAAGDEEVAPASDRGYPAACCGEDAAVAHFGEVSDKTSVADVLAAVEAAEAASEEAAADSGTEPEQDEDGFTEVPRRHKEAAVVEEPEAEYAAEDDEASDDETDGSSAGEWVTHDNMNRFGLGVEPVADVRATCASADYSVQNVLLQMGITPLTFDGYAVRSVKLWGLVCRGCFHFTRDTQKVFCPKCGNDTVVKVPIIVDQDGQANILNSGRPMRRKGSVYSVPKVQGGRGWKPIYAEDDVMIGGRDRQLRHAENLQNKERQTRDPFNEDNATRAWYQRGGNGSKGGPSDMPRLKAGVGRGNPNANNFKHKTSKKR